MATTLTLIDVIAENRRNKDQPVHISASSINLHKKCPRQWQDKYVLGKKDESVSAAIVQGSAAHKALSRLMLGQDVGNFWQETMDETDVPVVWEKDEETAKAIAEAHVYHYWEYVGKYLNVVAAEIECWIGVPGVPLPLLAFPDAHTDSTMIDYKSTRYYSRKQVRPNGEWKIAQAIYQLAIPLPSEIHVLTRSKSDPVVIPDSKDHPLHFGRFDDDRTRRMIQQEWDRMVFNFSMYGEEPWPGNELHEYAGKYCQREDCCSL